MSYPECNCIPHKRPIELNDCYDDFCNFNDFTGECGGGVCVYKDTE